MAPVVLSEQGEGNLTESWACASWKTPSKKIKLLLKAQLWCILRKSLIPTQQECARHSGMSHLERKENSKWQSHGNAQQEPARLARFCSQITQDKSPASRTFPTHKSVGPHPPRMTTSAFPDLSYFKLRLHSASVNQPKIPWSKDTALQGHLSPSTSFDTPPDLIYYNTFNEVPASSFAQLNLSLCSSLQSLSGLGKCK